MGCIICDPVVAKMVRQGLPPDPSHQVQAGKLHEREGRLLDVECSVCESRARLRAVGAILERSAEFIDPNDDVFLVSASQQERYLYKKFWRKFTHVSLLSNWNDPDCVIGVDITTMPQIDSERYGVIILLNVLDYIPNAPMAMEELARILKRGGTILFYIQSFRLEPHAEKIRVLSHNAYGDPQYSRQAGRETGIPDCRFDPAAIPEWTVAAGMKPGIVRIRDHVGDLEVDIFTARKE